MYDLSYMVARSLQDKVGIPVAEQQSLAYGENQLGNYTRLWEHDIQKSSVLFLA